MRPLLAIFAHPDDEAFGPAGFIALEAQKRDVHLVCVTNGEAGKNSSQSHKELPEIRKNELRKSASILGVKTVTFLGYKDGTLCNELYHEIATTLEKMIKRINPEALLTFEQKGLSGHIDHITVAMICSFIFRQNKTIKSLYFYAIPESRQEYSRRETYFIYYPKGYKDEEIHKTVSTESVWELKRKAILSHSSQKHDSSAILGRIEKLPKEEHFLVESR